MPQLSGNSYWSFFHGKARAYLFTTSILAEVPYGFCPFGTVQLEWGGKCTETKFNLAGKWQGPCKSVGVTDQSTSGSLFCSCMTFNSYPLPSPVSPSLPLPHIIVCHVILIRPYSDLILRGKPYGVSSSPHFYPVMRSWMCVLLSADHHHSGTS
jgi:hypothetical protein